jgi:NADPH-dependent curcumin reductase CurA
MNSEPFFAREQILVRRPAGHVDDTCFELRERLLPALGKDEVLVDQLVLSIDPYMYIRASGDERTARGAYQLGDVPDGLGVGRVRETRSGRFQVGDLVTSSAGWRDRYVALAADLQPLPEGLELPPDRFVAVVGATSFTAWVGFTAFVEAKRGQTIYVTGAAGGVGMIATQLALRAGLKVIASAGTPEKCAWLASLGDVHAINYRTTPDLAGALQEAVPDGIDLCFDTVGGRHMEAAISALRPHGHLIACGSMSTIVPGDNPADLLTDLRLVPVQCCTIHGYTVSRFLHLFPAFLDYMRDWMADGGPIVPVTVHEGIESAPAALRSLFGGGNLGKTLVRVGR